MEFLTTFHSIWTVVLLLAFLTMVVWAFSGRHRHYFDDVGRSAVNDDDSVIKEQTGENKHV